MDFFFYKDTVLEKKKPAAFVFRMEGSGAAASHSRGASSFLWPIKDDSS